MLPRFQQLYHSCNVSERHLGAQSECNPSLHRTLYFLSICRMGATITHNMTFHAWISRTSFQTKEDWTVTNTKWCDQSQIIQIVISSRPRKSPHEKFARQPNWRAEWKWRKREFSEKFGVRREPFRTGEDKTWSGGSVDPLFGPGPRTTIMDRFHGHFVNFYRRVLYRVHEHSFLNGESWTNTEKKQKTKKQDLTRRCRPMLTIDYKYLVVLTWRTLCLYMCGRKTVNQKLSPREELRAPVQRIASSIKKQAGVENSLLLEQSWLSLIAILRRWCSFSSS